ncbi:MAG: Helix-turn-helix domain [Acidimicrobiales bacterium]|nr:Helix-turn-helix domain [Acidimicrobiales bacterium]
MTHDNPSLRAQLSRSQALGRAIRDARRGLMTQAELGEQLAFPQSCISAWEHGQTELSLERLASIERALRLPPGRLAVEAGYVGDDALRLFPAAMEEDSHSVHFPVRVRGWLRLHSPLVESLVLLRSSGDDEALNALLESRKVKSFRLAWEIWERMLPRGESPATHLTAHLRADLVAACMFGVWGIDTGQEAYPGLRAAESNA